VIDVSDLYDAFHAIAQSIWRDFGAAVDDESWDDIIDGLEMDLFLTACAHRFNGETGGSAEPEEMPAQIRLVNAAGEVQPGGGGQYHSHAFYPDPETGDVPNAVMTGSLLSRSRTDVALVISPQGSRQRPRRAQLPQLP
jgi:hypothetical protein